MFRPSLPQPSMWRLGRGAESEANQMKARFDALGVAIRAGVDPEDAARRVGLPGVKFTGGVPVSLRMPGDEP